MIANVTRSISCNAKLDGDKYYDHNGALVNRNVPIARTGIFTYKGFEFGLTGKEAQKEFRVWRQINSFSPKVIETFKGIPVTTDHPSPDGVTPKNYTQNNVGNLGDKFFLETGNKVTDLIADKFIIRDQKAIDLVEKDGNKEISIGVSASYDFSQPGITPDGEPYDGLETIISGNHIAIVIDGTGKAGPKYKLNSIQNEVNIVDKETLEKLAELSAAILSLNSNVEKLTAQTTKSIKTNEDYVARAQKIEDTQLKINEEKEKSEKEEDVKNSDTDTSAIDKMKGKTVNEDADEKEDKKDCSENSEEDLQDRPGVNASNMANRKSSHNSQLKSTFKTIHVSGNSNKDAIANLTDLYKQI